MGLFVFRFSFFCLTKRRRKKQWLYKVLIYDEVEVVDFVAQQVGEIQQVIGREENLCNNLFVEEFAR